MYILSLRRGNRNGRMLAPQKGQRARVRTQHVQFLQAHLVFRLRKGCSGDFTRTLLRRRALRCTGPVTRRRATRKESCSGCGWPQDEQRVALPSVIGCSCACCHICVTASTCTHVRGLAFVNVCLRF